MSNQSKKNDRDRVLFIGNLLKNCPDVSFHFNDDVTLEEVGGPPVGYTIRVGGHDEVKATASSFRKCVDSMRAKMAVPAE